MCQRLCQRMCAWALLLVCSRAAAGPPPPPNPANPVNYVEWINQTFGGDIKGNAYDTYRQAYESITPFEGDWKAVTTGPWSDNQAVSDWLAKHRRALMRFREAAAMPACYFPMVLAEQAPSGSRGQFLITGGPPSLRPHREACKGLIADGYEAWQKGDHLRLPNNALVVLRSGHHFDNNPILICRLAGTACCALGYKVLLRSLQLSDAPADLARQILPELEAADPPCPGLESAVVVERLCTWDACQRVFVPGTKEGTWTVERESLEGLWRAADVPAETRAAASEIDYRQTLSQFNAYFDAVDEWMRLPYHQAAGRADDLGQIVKESKNALVEAFVSSLTDVRVMCERAAAYRRGTHLVFHVLVHQISTGDFPASLDEIKAADLAQLRVDPFSGRGLVYRKTADGFTLYTVGEDLKDDGGKHDEHWGMEGGDFVFWPVPE